MYLLSIDLASDIVAHFAELFFDGFGSALSLAYADIVVIFIFIVEELFSLADVVVVPKCLRLLYLTRVFVKRVAKAIFGVDFETD